MQNIFLKSTASCVQLSHAAIDRAEVISYFQKDNIFAMTTAAAAAARRCIMDDCVVEGSRKIKLIVLIKCTKNGNFV